MYEHIETSPKWQTLCRWQIQVPFLLIIFNSNSTEICSKGSKWQWASNNSDHELTPHRLLWHMTSHACNEKSPLFQVTAWCRQMTSHYLSQSWPNSMSPYGITGPQWVWTLGLYSLRRRRLMGIGIPIINLRRSDDRLRFIMGIPILIRQHLLGE